MQVSKSPMYQGKGRAISVFFIVLSRNGAPKRPHGVLEVLSIIDHITSSALVIVVKTP